MDLQTITQLYDFTGRTAVITGGAGVLASEIACALIGCNANVVILDRDMQIKITANILRYPDEELGSPLVDYILDEAAQKGTGKWTSQNALDVGAPIPTINAAVESRILSSLRTQRVKASKVIRGPKPEYTGDRQRLARRTITGQPDPGPARLLWRAYLPAH